MASQTTKIIDVTRSYIPVDPQAFPENLSIFTKEDGQEKGSPIVPFEGYNFLPTSYGYKSYFGVTSKLDIDALTSRVDKIIVLQTSQFVNIAVALCEDGIWTKRANSSGAWVHEIVLAVPMVGRHYEWSYCFLDNDFFAYRANGTAYYKFSNLPRTVTAGEIAGALPTVLDPATINPAGKFYAATPNFLNMAGQEGIFKAGSRLGFWDSANSIAWSSIDDYADFTPAVLTMAGSAIFNEVQGRITNILSMGDGFVVYSTKSITVIARDDTGTMQWNPYVALKDAGIAFRRECCIGNTPTSQYAYTQVGLVKVEGPKAATIVDELGDFLKESAQPVYLTLIDQRYLFLEILDSDYLDSLVTFTIETLPSTNYPFPSRPVPSVYNSNYVKEVFDGTNTDLLNLIDNYILGNGLSLRAEDTPVTTVYSGSLLDRKQYKSLDEFSPSFLPTSFPMNNVVPRGWAGNPTVGTIGNYVSATGLYNTFWAAGTDVSDEAYILTDISYLGIVGGLPGYNYSVVRMTPVLQAGTNNSRALTSGEKATGLNGVVELQKNTWASHNEDMRKLCAYIGSLEHPESDVLLSGTAIGSWDVCYNDFASPSLLLDRLKYGVQSANILNNDTNYVVFNADDLLGSSGYYTNFIAPLYVSTKYKGDYSVLKETAIFNCDLEWEEPTLSLVGDTATLKRVLKHEFVLYARVDLKGEPVAEAGEFTYVDANPLPYPTFPYHEKVHSSVYAYTVASLVRQPTEVYESVEYTIDGYNYEDAGGIVHFIPYTPALALPDIPPFYFTGDGGTVTLPPTSFLLQNGSIGPVYPTIPGALVYDLALKKWGKIKQDYKCLVDWSPINNLSGNTIPYETFGMQGGVLLEDGKIALFDKYPIDSYLKYGKIGYFRQGFTSAEEVRVTMRSHCTGSIRVESSLDGCNVELGLTKIDEYTNTNVIIMFPSTSARWHTISFIGEYDIKNLEFRGTIVGNR